MCNGLEPQAWPSGLAKSMVKEGDLCWLEPGGSTTQKMSLSCESPMDVVWPVLS